MRASCCRQLYIVHTYFIIHIQALSEFVIYAIFFILFSNQYDILHIDSGSCIVLIATVQSESNELWTCNISWLVLISLGNPLRE